MKKKSLVGWVYHGIKGIEIKWQPYIDFGGTRHELFLSHIWRRKKDLDIFSEDEIKKVRITIEEIK